MNALDRVHAQKACLSARLRRSALTEVVATWPLRNAILNCRRNEVFEFAVEPLKALAAYSGFDLQVRLGPYDDTLACVVTEPADAELVWLNYERYTISEDALLNWLKSRLVAIRAQTGGQILINNWAGTAVGTRGFNRALAAIVAAIPDVYIVDIAALQDRLGSSFFDQRLTRIAGAAFSEQTYLELARLIGLVMLPSLLRAPLKAVVFDGDETLWSGVLSEDGVAGIHIDDGHRDLHQAVRELRQLGVFTAVLSKNDRSDIETVFAERQDLELSLADFDVVVANWESKSEGLIAIANALHIAPDAMLFVDDNPGELAAVAHGAPQTQLLMAGPEAADTARGLRLYPSLFFRRSTREDGLRSKDLAADEARETIRTKSSDPKDYVRSLQMTVDVVCGPEVDVVRASEISNKTNQFNLAYARLTAAAVARQVAEPGHRVVTMALSDRLSDSGVIGLLAAQSNRGILQVIDLCLSCRALGRGVEDFLISAALVAAAGDDVSSIVFPYRRQSRNQPALDWLSTRTGMELIVDEGTVTLAWRQAREAEALKAMPIHLAVNGVPSAG